MSRSAGLCFAKKTPKCSKRFRVTLSGHLAEKLADDTFPGTPFEKRIRLSGVVQWIDSIGCVGEVTQQKRIALYDTSRYEKIGSEIRMKNE